MLMNPDAEFDTRLRASLEPTPETVDRVKATALQVDPRRRSWTALYALAGVLGVLVVVATLGSWRREPAAVEPTVFTAEFSGELLVIRAANGSVTLLGPPAPSPSPAARFQMMYEGGTK